jgi:hypothetical protein
MGDDGNCPLQATPQPTRMPHAPMTGSNNRWTRQTPTPTSTTRLDLSCINPQDIPVLDTPAERPHTLYDATPFDGTFPTPTAMANHAHYGGPHHTPPAQQPQRGQPPDGAPVDNAWTSTPAEQLLDHLTSLSVKNMVPTQQALATAKQTSIFGLPQELHNRPPTPRQLDDIDHNARLVAQAARHTCSLLHASQASREEASRTFTHSYSVIQPDVRPNSNGLAKVTT